jgi:hypothetical protein
MYGTCGRTQKSLDLYIANLQITNPQITEKLEMQNANLQSATFMEGPQIIEVREFVNLRFADLICARDNCSTTMKIVNFLVVKIKRSLSNFVKGIY